MAYVWPDDDNALEVIRYFHNTPYFRDRSEMLQPQKQKDLAARQQCTCSTIMPWPEEKEALTQYP